MRIIINLGTPKQVRFLSLIGKKLQELGHDIEFVSRTYTETNIMIDELKIKSTAIGQFGGDSKLGKLKASAERISMLSDFFASFRPDLAISLGNHEFVRTSFGLGVPVVLFCDFPENIAVSCLTLPLATRVLAPFCIPEMLFQSYGVSPERIKFYNSFDPMLWLSDSSIDKSYRNQLSFDLDLPLVVLRETEWQSNYIKHDIINEVASRLHDIFPDLQIVSIPRYSDHKYVDIPSLLATADILICGGGTMCIEAAFFGTPVIATRRLSCHYMDWLFVNELAIYSCEVSSIVEKTIYILKNRIRTDRNKLSRLPFPTDTVINWILEVGEGDILPRNVERQGK
jgi:predicted glycosyltransferase